MPSYRSTLEKRIARSLELNNHPFEYETMRLPYTWEAVYTPDFILPNGVILEAKGWLKPEDRRKMLCVKKAHPDRDIRFVFQQPYNTISSRSKTTYAAWAEKHGFPWAPYHSIPSEWFEPQP